MYSCAVVKCDRGWKVAAGAPPRRAVQSTGKWELCRWVVWIWSVCPTAYSSTCQQPSNVTCSVLQYPVSRAEPVYSLAGWTRKCETLSVCRASVAINVLRIRPSRFDIPGHWGYGRSLAPGILASGLFPVAVACPCSTLQYQVASLPSHHFLSSHHSWLMLKASGFTLCTASAYDTSRVAARVVNFPEI